MPEPNYQRLRKEVGGFLWEASLFLLGFFVQGMALGLTLFALGLVPLATWYALTSPWAQGVAVTYLKVQNPSQFACMSTIGVAVCMPLLFMSVYIVACTKFGEEPRGNQQAGFQYDDRTGTMIHLFEFRANYVEVPKPVRLFLLYPKGSRINARHVWFGPPGCQIFQLKNCPMSKEAILWHTDYRDDTKLVWTLFDHGVPPSRSVYVTVSFLDGKGELPYAIGFGSPEDTPLSVDELTH